jgi:hypothetical protein
MHTQEKPQVFMTQGKHAHILLLMYHTYQHGLDVLQENQSSLHPLSLTRLSMSCILLLI